MANRIHDLIPHRVPMLLIDSFVHVDDQSSSARVQITENSSFYTSGKGVPSWIGVEYMGQTAAMIAGYQLEQETVKPHVGLLLGTRKFNAEQSWFTLGSQLRVSCKQIAMVGDNLATFACEILHEETQKIVASAKLSVYRTDKNNSEELG